MNRQVHVAFYVIHILKRTAFADAAYFPAEHPSHAGYGPYVGLVSWGKQYAGYDV